jgi:sodium/proline symporter
MASLKVACSALLQPSGTQQGSFISMTHQITGAEVVFFITLAVTFWAAVLGWQHAKKHQQGGLAHQNLNRWFIGLSAGATANSGFVVTGAVGLGYSYGVQWLFLPIAWLLGDIVFWFFFPSRINAAGRSSGATTLSELLTHNVSGGSATIASIIATLLIIICLGGYTSAQWLAGQKFLSGAFDISDITALGLFACIIIAYTTIGGFRGSVYADSVQAIIRIVGTFIALSAVIWFALADMQVFWKNLNAVGGNFKQVIPGNTISAFIGFILGFASAALGFGLGQPQLVSRYLAGSSPQETKSAWWLYIGFVQFTWIAMTLFGVLLRGVMPEVSDPEAGLSVFFTSNLGPIVTGIIVADIFATIAATSNSLLVAMAQAVTHDLLPSYLNPKTRALWTTLSILVLGTLTMVGSLLLSGQKTVFELAIASVSLMGAGLAAPVMIKVMGWRRSGTSLLYSIVAGLAAAVSWKYSGLSGQLNEAAIGIAVGLIINWLIACRSKSVHVSLQVIKESFRHGNP